MITFGVSTDFPMVCLWMLGSVALSAGVWGILIMLPGTRDRCIFRRNNSRLLRWLQGEYSITHTLITGGPITAVALWWVVEAGLVPTGICLQLIFTLWCVLLAVALLNTARKSQPEGAPCAGVVILITLLLLASGVCAAQSVIRLMAGNI